MLDNMVRLVIDPLFPPPDDFVENKFFNSITDICSDNKFELIFDETIDGPILLNLHKGENESFMENPQSGIEDSSQD
jgi:hypothetical protein